MLVLKSVKEPNLFWKTILGFSKSTSPEEIGNFLYEDF